MIDRFVTVLPDGTEVCVSTQGVDVFVQSGFCVEVGAGTGVNIGDWLSQLPEYNSDEAANAGGVALNGWYRAGAMHDQVKWGTPTQVKVI